HKEVAFTVQNINTLKIKQTKPRLTKVKDVLMTAKITVIDTQKLAHLISVQKAVTINQKCNNHHLKHHY
ncbi:hypothetical protein THERMOT_1589, partial [Bathymodiolus thermophilus thioautotrophic gill symbiont]|uniref:hypothetical protein n=1 Tax=Bathymodiolus thermophilus thioautotrophic gill symbiont TaxID=2360 RepID=UPI001A1AB34D